MKKNREIITVVFCTFMCAVLVAHGYISLTQFGKNLSSAQLVEETVEEEQSETKDGKSECEELIKQIQELNVYKFDFISTFSIIFVSHNEVILLSQFKKIHLPPPDFTIS